MKHLKHTYLSRVTSLLLALTTTMLLTACFDSSGSSGSTPTVTPAGDLPLAQLHWCPDVKMKAPSFTAYGTPGTTATSTSTPGATATAKPGTTPPSTATVAATPGTPTTLTDWSEVKADLGFTVYLPSALPRNTCLESASAVIHAPTVGGSFLIAYRLPDDTSIIISEIPLASQNTSFICNVYNTSNTTGQKHAASSTATPQITASPTPTPLQLCFGAKSTTYIGLSARKSIKYLQQVFTLLQSDVTWIPAT